MEPNKKLVEPNNKLVEPNNKLVEPINIKENEMISGITPSNNYFHQLLLVLLTDYCFLQLKFSY